MVNRGAEEAIAMQGRNVLAPGVKGYDRDVREGDFVYVVNKEWKAIAVSKATQEFRQKLSEGKGMIVKIKTPQQGQRCRGLSEESYMGQCSRSQQGLHRNEGEGSHNLHTKSLCRETASCSYLSLEEKTA